MEVKDYKDIISRIEKIPKELLSNRLNAFSYQNFPVMTEEEIKSSWTQTFAFNPAVIISFPRRKATIRTKLFRINYIGENEDFFENITEEKFWEAPKEFAKDNRFSRKGEPALYVSQWYATALREFNIKKGEKFLLCIYIIKSEFEYQPIGLYPTETNSEIPCTNNCKILDFQASFLRRKKTNANSNYLYKITRSIGDTTGSLPDNPIAYPAVYDSKKYHFCFTPKQAHAFLEIDGAWLCEYKSNTHNFGIKGIYKGFKNGKAQFFECDTPEQLKFYPEIKLKKEYRKN